MALKPARINLSAPEDLFEMVQKDALLNDRSLSNQVVWVLKQYYVVRKKEAELFTPSQLREEERLKAPVFRMKDEPDESALPKHRERPSRENS